jgi:hypothetical protein
MKKKKINAIIFVLSLFLSFGIPGVTLGEKSEDAPKELREIITKIDFAANKRNFDMLKDYISPNFVTQDGLNYESFHESLKNLWQNYSDVTYKTTLTFWEKKDNQFLAKTVTEIKGNYHDNGHKFTLFSTIQSLQYFENGQLIKQEILSERTDLTAGENPPEVEVRLPQKVRPGEQFYFDVIVKEPLGYNLLLGEAIEDKITSESYLDPSEIELKSLSAGGIFKLVTAPQTLGDRWYSAILIRSDGMRLITQRVKVAN